MFESMVGIIAHDYTKNAVINSAIENATKTIISSANEAHTSVKKYAKETSKCADDIFESYWPEIEKLVLSSLVDVVEAGFENDATLEIFFKTTYQVMPTPFRLIISKNKYVGFCMSKKETILKSLSKYKEENKNNMDNLNYLAIDNTVSSTDETTTVSIYEKLMPELIAFCIVADGLVEDKEIELATAIINSDENISNKDSAIESLSLYIETNISNKQSSDVLYKLNLSSFLAKVSKLEKQEEKERIDIIVQGMLGSVQEGSLPKTKDMADRIIGKLSILEPA